MRIYKNSEVNKDMIKQIRETIKAGSTEDNRFLGICSENICQELPLKNKSFNIWVLCSDDNRIIGYFSFQDMDNDVKFIKAFYIMREFRRQGFGKYLINLFYESYPKLDCKINQGNNTMYKLVESIGMRGKKSIISELRASDAQPIWWSNY